MTRSTDFASFVEAAESYMLSVRTLNPAFIILRFFIHKMIFALALSVKHLASLEIFAHTVRIRA